MTLLDRMEKAVQAASEAEVTARRGTEAKVIEDVAAQVRTFRLGLVAAAARRGALVTHTATIMAWPDSAKALAALEAFHLAFRAAPTGGKAELRRLVATLKKVVEGAEQSVSDAVAHCRRSLRDDARPLDDLSSVEGFVDQVAAAKEAVEALLGQDWERADGEALAVLLKRRATLQQRLDSLTHIDVPKTVRIFFREARKASGAGLDLLTDEVVAWLEQNGKMDRVRLIIK